MKHLVLLSILTVLLFACRKDPVTPKTEEELLPPATQEGKRTFGCLINGKAWTPKAGFVPPPISVSYDEISGQCGIITRRNLGDDLLQGVSIGGVFRETGSFDLGFEGGMWIDTSFTCAEVIWLRQYRNTNGTLTISKVDRSTGIIAGTFEFDAVSSMCNDTVRITQGRFDVRYKYQ